MMWAATVLVCLSAGGCMRFDDMYGPYDTRPECEARVYEMAIDLMAMGRQQALALPRHIELRCHEAGPDGEAV